MLPKALLTISLATRALAAPSQTQQYPSCGGFTQTPHNCDARSTCMDDPRTPGSCGMACDAPGICVPNKAATCQTGNETCPKGQECFADLRVKCKGKQCQGFCLYPKKE